MVNGRRIDHLSKTSCFTFGGTSKRTKSFGEESMFPNQSTMLFIGEYNTLIILKKEQSETAVYSENRDTVPT